MVRHKTVIATDKEVEKEGGGERGGRTHVNLSGSLEERMTTKLHPDSVPVLLTFKAHLLNH